MKEKFNRLKHNLEFKAETPDFLKKLKQPKEEEISIEKQLEYEQLLAEEEKPVIVDLEKADIPKVGSSKVVKKKKVIPRKR